jgi:uncharacterized protein (TIGR00369 family)
MSEAVRAPKTTRHLEELQRMARDKVGVPPNPMGTLHGGVVCDLSDAAMGTAMATTLEDDESFTTLDLTVKFFKPIWDAKLRATAHVVKRTRTLGLVECEVEDEQGSLVAKVYSTCMVLRGQEAKGR